MATHTLGYCVAFTSIALTCICRVFALSEVKVDNKGHADCNIIMISLCDLKWKIAYCVRNDVWLYVTVRSF